MLGRAAEITGLRLWPGQFPAKVEDVRLALGG